MEQRSDEWHEDRRTMINASEAGPLLGLSPYTSAKQARKEWVAKYRGHRRDFDNADMARGRRLEPPILEAVEVEFNDIVLQDGGRTFDGWLRASADGWMGLASEERWIVEAKAPRKFFDPDERLDYLMQMFLQCVCYDARMAVMAQGVEADDGTLELRTKPYTIDHLGETLEKAISAPVMTALKILHADMVAEAELPEVEEEVFSTPAWQSAQVIYDHAKAAESEAKAMMAEAREQLLAACDSKPVRGTRWQVTEATRIGNVNWRKLQTEHPDIELDQYRSKPTTSLSIREVK